METTRRGEEGFAASVIGSLSLRRVPLHGPRCLHALDGRLCGPDAEIVRL